MNMQRTFFHDPLSRFSLLPTQNTFQFSEWPSSLRTPGENPFEKPPPKSSKVLKALTGQLLQTYQKCNPRFFYDPRNNPKRCLTHPPEGVHNEGHDNINNEYILYLRDFITSPENHEYQIQELLGKGTFGQVIRCVRVGTDQEFAMKVIKNKPAYTNQALAEIKIYRKLREENPQHKNYIVFLYDYFVFRNHICLVFEILHMSLYDLLRMNNHLGFSLRFSSRLVQYILEGMACLEMNKIIHCDLKPENILFADSDQSDALKLIDLGSSCFYNNTVFTYIQSRFYRAPEVILGLKYTNKIDSWSLGCIVGELYLGLPIFPGSSEYDQMKRITDVIGMPDDEIIEMGRFKNLFFKKGNDGHYILKTAEEYEATKNVKIAPHKKYFILDKLEDLESYYYKSKQRERYPLELDRQTFDSFIHFLRGLLQIDPVKRWSSSQALFHPFITGEEFDPDWQPPSAGEALKAFEAKLEKQQVNQEISDLAFFGFSNTPTKSLNNESYRPFIPSSQSEKKEEVLGQSQNVFLLNNQTNSTKPKSKLNPKATSFNLQNFKVADLKKEGLFKGNSQTFTSDSEPNSARSLDAKQHFNKKLDDSHYNKKQQQQRPQGFSNNFTNGHQKKNNDAHMFCSYSKPPAQQQFYQDQCSNPNPDYFKQSTAFPYNQFSLEKANQNNNLYRQRSNSENGPNVLDQFGKAYNKKDNYYKKRRNRGHFANQANLQDVPNQPTPDTAETSYSSNDFEFKNRVGSLGLKPLHHDEMKEEEFKEEDLL